MMTHSLDQQNLHPSPSQRHASKRDLPPLIKMSITLPLDHHGGNLQSSERHASMRVLPFCTPPCTGEDDDPTPQSLSGKYPLKSKAHKCKFSYCPLVKRLINSLKIIVRKKFPLKSKIQRQEGSIILPSTSSHQTSKSVKILPFCSPLVNKFYYTRDRRGNLHSSQRHTNGRVLPFCPPLMIRLVYHHVLDGSDETTLPPQQSKYYASVTPISLSNTDPGQSSVGSGSSFPFSHFHSRKTRRRWNEKFIYKSVSFSVRFLQF